MSCSRLGKTPVFVCVDRQALERLEEAPERSSTAEGGRRACDEMRAVLHNNRAACFLRTDRPAEALAEAEHALEVMRTGLFVPLDAPRARERVFLFLE